MQLVDLFEDWQSALSEFNSVLKAQVKAMGQAKVLAQIKIADTLSAEEKSLTRSSYNARLQHPQYWPLPLVNALADVLASPHLVDLFHRQQTIIDQLPALLTNYIKTSGVPNAFVIRGLSINQTTFYAKQKNPRTWRKPELERIEEIVETIRAIRPGNAVPSSSTDKRHKTPDGDFIP